MSSIRIGFTACLRPETLEPFIPDTYDHALTSAGLTPVLIPCGLDDAALDHLLPTLDGVLFSGGPDIDPALYGRERLPECGLIQPLRDDLELRLFRKVKDMSIPLMGICRGVQTLNVGFGGTLYQDVPSQCGELHRQTNPDLPACRHGITIEPDCLLARLCPQRQTTVNSFHHQAVELPGESLRVCAVSEGGRVIEAVEGEGRRFVLGVQWHPERTVDEDQLSAALFAAFADVCRAYAAQKSLK